MSASGEERKIAAEEARYFRLPEKLGGKGHYCGSEPALSADNGTDIVVPSIRATKAARDWGNP